MGILITVVIITLVVAAVGAGVYVLVFRAKHKKEVMANSQMMGENVPVYGPTSDQQAQGQPDIANMASVNQPSPAPNPMMNDITNSVQASEASPVSQPQTQEPVPTASQESQPSVSYSPAPETEQPGTQTSDVPPAPAGEAPVLDGPLDLSQLESQSSSENLLDDTQNAASITEMAKEENMSSAPDGDMADFSVPVTEGKSAVSVAPEVPTEPQQPAQEQPSSEPAVQPKPEQNAPSDIPAPTAGSQPEAISSAPEPLVAPEATVPADNTVPPPPAENAVPAQDNTEDEQDTSAQEMHI